MSEQPFILKPSDASIERMVWYIDHGSEDDNDIETNAYATLNETHFRGERTIEWRPYTEGIVRKIWLELMVSGMDDERVLLDYFGGVDLNQEVQASELAEQLVSSFISRDYQNTYIATSGEVLEDDQAPQDDIMIVIPIDEEEKMIIDLMSNGTVKNFLFHIPQSVLDRIDTQNKLQNAFGRLNDIYAAIWEVLGDGSEQTLEF